MSDWNKYLLGDLCIVQNGYSFRSSEFNSEEANAFEVLKMGHIERGGGLRKSPRKDFVSRNDNFQKWILDKGDIVMAMTDMKDNVVILGVPAIVDKSNHYVLNQRVARIKVNDTSTLDTIFLYYYLIWDEHLLTLQSKAFIKIKIVFIISQAYKSTRRNYIV